MLFTFHITCGPVNSRTVMLTDKPQLLCNVNICCYLNWEWVMLTTYKLTSRGVTYKALWVKSVDDFITAVEEAMSCICKSVCCLMW